MTKPKQKYKFAVIATDVVIFTIENNLLKALLIEMKKEPYTKHWALPGGLVRPAESLNKAAVRHLAQKAGVKDAYLEQLYTFGDINRDPFGRVVSVAYMALVASSGLKLKTTKEYIDVRWFPVNHLPSLAYDHKDIIAYAIARLKAKLEYTNIVYSLLPAEFTLGALQNIYEIIQGKKMDKRNFRKKILSLKLVRPLDRKERGRANRPPELYSFAKRSPQIVQIL